MKNFITKLLICVLLLGLVKTNSVFAQGWTFPYPTEGAPCASCAPPGWTMISGSPDISSLDNWIGYPHYGPVAAIAPVPEPTPGVTSFMSAVAFGAWSEEVETSFVLATPEVLTIYFGGFGTSTSGGGPAGASAGVTASVLVNGTAATDIIPWDGAWHAVTYDLVVGMNTISFQPLLGDDDTRHAVHISIPADQPSDCTDDLVTVISDTDICLGDALTLEATSISGGTITWDMGVLNGIAFTPGTAGIITYTAESDLDSDCPFSVDITVRDLPVINAGADVGVCEGEDVTLAGTGAGVGGVYAWTGGVIDGAAFVPAATATYTVTGTDAHGCQNTDDVTVTLNPLPIIDAGADEVVCVGTDVTLAGSGAGLGGVYVWTGGVIDATPFFPGATATYTVTGTDANGCEGTDDVLVDVITTPVIDAGPDQEICVGETVTLTGSGAGVGGTYAWTGGVIDGTPFTPGATLTYTVTGTAAGGCFETDDVLVTVNPLPAISGGPSTTICQGEAITLSGSGGVAYVWSGGVVDGNPFTPAATATYTVTGTDANGCVNTADVTITLSPIPDSDFSGNPLSGCNPHPVNFSPVTAGATYSWSFGDGGTSALENPAHTYTTEGLFDVSLTVTSADGCVSTTVYPNYVDVLPQPIADFTFVTLDVDQGISGAQFDNQSLYADTYSWDFGDGASTDEENPTHIYSGVSEMGYVVELTATNSIGCEDKITKTVKMKDLLIYYIPNTFTPDGDDFNEYFKPIFVSGFDVYDFHMTIFNRWGEIVFETYDSNYGWNGTYGNKGTIQDGTYIWKIEFGDLNSDKKYYEEGHVTILK